MQQVLIVDDNPSVCTALEILFDVHGIPTVVAHTPDAALEIVARGDIGAVIQDMNFSDDTTSGQEGATLFRRLRELDGDLPVLLMTAWTSLETAVALVKEGAADYLAKPWDDAKVVTTVKNMLRLRELALENHRLRAQSARARNELQDRYDLCGLVYASEAMHRVVSLAASVARADAPVLISGPNGSGKEKVAEIVHANSPAPPAALRQGQRRRPARRPPRGRAVRRRGRRLHRRHQETDRPLRGRRRRHPVPRRDRQPHAQGPDEAPAGPADRRVRAPRQHRHPQGRRPHRLGHQRQPGAR
jgi:DNA-binding response OmpR family regulator